MTVKGKGKRSQGKGQSKGKHTVSDQETSGNERLDEMLRSLELFGMERQCVDWFGEQTSDVQIFILGTTDTRLTINDLHMRNSILPAAHADDRPIDDSVSVVPTCPKHMCI